MPDQLALTTERSLVAHYAAVRDRLNSGRRPQIKPSTPLIPPIVGYSFRATATLLDVPWPWKVKISYRKTRLEHANTARQLLREVCLRYGFSADDIRGPRRQAKIAAARMELYYLLRTHTDWSYPHIARFLNRDHSTIVHGVRTYCARNGLTHPDDGMTGHNHG